MKRLCIVALATLVAGFGANGAEGATYTHANLALHLAAPAAKSGTACTLESPVTKNIPCSSYVVDGSLSTSYAMYLVIAGADPADTSEALASGTRGLTLGISYNGATSQGVDVSAWTSCADLDIGANDWPNSGGGNVITWADCQTHTVDPDGVHVVVGAFAIYVYSEDRFSITLNNKLGVPALQVADCASGRQWDVDPIHAAQVSFDPLHPGCNPCLDPCPVPVETVTWGKIKNLYQRN
jgi:hypothetical protein